MNFITTIIDAMYETPFARLAVSFLASTLETEDAILLITDAKQAEAYELVLKRLKGVQGPLSLSTLELLPDTRAAEVVIIHSRFDLDLLREVATAPFVERVVFITPAAWGSESEMRTINRFDDPSDERMRVTFAYHKRYMNPPVDSEANTAGAEAVFARLNELYKLE